MNKRLLCLLFTSLILLVPMKANASYKTGWIPHEYCENMNNYHGAWEYLYSNGQHAQNWANIGGKWYYFSTDDGCAFKNRSLLEDGYFYYFKDDCSMACNEWVYCEEVGYSVYADEHGHLQGVY